MRRLRRLWRHVEPQHWIAAAAIAAIFVLSVLGGALVGDMRTLADRQQEVLDRQEEVIAEQRDIIERQERRLERSEDGVQCFARLLMILPTERTWEDVNEFCPGVLPRGPGG